MKPWDKILRYDIIFMWVRREGKGESEGRGVSEGRAGVRGNGGYSSIKCFASELNREKNS